MNFAKRELEKYGWTKGKGLGKEETGIVEALKPKPKRSLGGLGHDMADEFTNHWWNKVYNNATSNVKINTSENGEVQSFIVENDKVKHSKCKSNKMPLYFQTFVQAAVLQNGNTTHNSDNSISNCPEIYNSETNNEFEFKTNQLTDEELFIACGKRTAHKGARHGLKLNGKLARLEMQEKILLSKQKISKDSSKKKSDNDSSVSNKKNKKKHKKIIEQKKLKRKEI